MESDAVRFIDAHEALERVMASPVALLYKHSTRCGTSLRALLQVERFARAEPDVPVFGIDVIRQRELSDLAAERMGVPHQSPQAVLLRNGVPVWRASHAAISAPALEEAVRQHPGN